MANQFPFSVDYTYDEKNPDKVKEVIYRRMLQNQVPSGQPEQFSVPLSPMGKNVNVPRQANVYDSGSERDVAHVMDPSKAYSTKGNASTPVGEDEALRDLEEYFLWLQSQVPNKSEY